MKSLSKSLPFDLVTVALLTFAPFTETNAADINGIVRSAIPDYATVTSDSDLIPMPGDKADIFFKMAGQDIEVSVASGHVHEITGSNIMVKIDQATGTVAKDQLVRIKSPGARKRPTPTYLGVQMTADPEGANGARVVEVMPNSPAAAAGFLLGDLIVAIDGSPVESPDQVSNAVIPLTPGTRHPFLVSRDGKMKKLEATLAQLPSELAAASPALVAAASPPETLAPVDPTPDPSKPPDEQQISIGDARYNRRDFDGAIEAYNAAINLNPKNSWGYRNRGAALVQKDQYESAIANYQEAIRLDPKRWKESLGESIKDLKDVLRNKSETAK